MIQKIFIEVNPATSIDGRHQNLKLVILFQSQSQYHRRNDIDFAMITAQKNYNRTSNLIIPFKANVIEEWVMGDFVISFKLLLWRSKFGGHIIRSE